MVCPECGERAWRYDPVTWTCRHGHRTADAAPRASIIPPPPVPVRWRWLPYVGGGCGIAALLVELAVRL